MTMCYNQNNKCKFVTFRSVKWVGFGGFSVGIIELGI